MKKLFIKTACIALALFSVTAINAQKEEKSKAKAAIVAWDGMMIAGYVNDGGYVNFGGPSLKLIKKPWSLGFGILPTMRIKEDKVAAGAKKNSAVMPTAGFGFTVVYKHFVVQVPFYYNAKTASSDGKWHPGFGVGYKL
jgi:hypothetical protein